ncbi:CapA family protein [Paenibacillus oenotherae]|uniref:CapA family protein n=2 Tax=Paenibacillus oenotherae TaxID=1435645 RepID=A0ABS7D2F2_9BACL|nr:CapA family protein [Paenibacillus oenotherae]
MNTEPLNAERQGTEKPGLTTDTVKQGQDQEQGQEQGQEQDPDAAVGEDPVTKPDTSEPPLQSGTSDALWVAVGDIMMHMPQLPAYYDKSAKRYDFNPYFTEVKPLLEQGDWSLANLETPISGKELGYSGFPRFNAPSELAEALKYAGFNIVTNANNHSLDRGAEGIARTLRHLEEQGFSTKGTARSKAEAEALTIIERQGIGMGLLAYTYGTNGIPLPKDKPYSVAIIDEKAIIRDINRLREAGADFITVVLHFGIEYQTVPNDTQKQLARKLIAAGADIIAGAHPHVVQPYETVDVTEADGSLRRGLIIYSMGNFISNQRGETKDCGVIFKVHIHKDHASGITAIGDIEAIPTWVHRVKKNKANHYQIIPMEQAIKHGTTDGLSAADYKEMKRNLSVLSKRLQSMSAKPVMLNAEAPVE